MANEIEMGIAVSANTEGAKKGLTELKSIIAETSKESDKQGKASEEASRKEEEGAKKAAEASEKTAEATKKATEAAENLAKQEASTAAELGKTASAANNANGAIASLSSVFGAAGAQASAAAQSMSREASANNEVANTAKNATNSVNELNKEINKNSENTGKASLANSDLTSTLNILSPSIAGLATKLTGAMAAVEAAKMALDGLKKVAEATIETIKEGIEIQSSLEQTEIRVSHAYQDVEKTAKTMELIPKYAREWGASMKEVGESAEVISRLGGDFSELSGYVRDVSAVTGKSLPEVSNIIGRAMQGSARALRQMQEQLGITSEDLYLYGAAVDEDGEIMAKTKEEQEALADAVADFAKHNYGEAYLDYASTAAGATDNLSEAVEQLTRSLGAPFSGALETVKNAMAQLIYSFLDSQDAIDAAKSAAIEAFKAFIESATVLGNIPGVGEAIVKGAQIAIDKLDEIAKKADEETKKRREQQAEDLKKHVAELRKLHPEIDVKSKADKEAEKEEEKALKLQEKIRQAAEKERQRQQAAEDKRAKREEDNKRKQAERDQRNADKIAERRRKEEQKRLDDEQKRYNKELADQQKLADKALRDAHKIAAAKAGAPVTSTAATATEPAKTDKFAGFRIGINKETGAWEWQKDQSAKFAGYNLVKNQDTGAWEWRKDQSAKFEGMVAYQTESGAWEWRKSTLQQEQAEATAQATEATQNFAESAQSASDNLATASNDLTEAFKRLAEASSAVFAGFSNVARSAESISNYNISNNVRVDNTLSSGINERQIIQSASAIAQREMSQNLNQSAIIGNNTGFLF